jgi:Helix-turn-helix domain of resolvase/Resolvase, N terminal domain
MHHQQLPHQLVEGLPVRIPGRLDQQRMRLALLPQGSPRLGGLLVVPLRALFAALAEFERDLVRERTSAGLAAAWARGRQGGRPTVLTGHKLQVAQEMYRSGRYTVAAIAKTLGVSRAWVYRHLARAGG